MLSLRLEFSLFQKDIEERFAESLEAATYFLEPDSHTPIIEADVAVVNAPAQAKEEVATPVVEPICDSTSGC